MSAVTEQEFAAVINERYQAPAYDRLKAARVGIAGLGGLGSNIAIALARSGVGNLKLVDFDRIDLSNINRQAYRLDQIGKLKTEALKEEISKINPFCTVEIETAEITNENAATVFDDYPIICEAFDNPEAKAMLINTILEQCPDKTVVSASGLAGYEDPNTIQTRRISERFYLSGDRVSDINDGNGLTAPRVLICAGHQGTTILRLILNS